MAMSLRPLGNEQELGNWGFLDATPLGNVHFVWQMQHFQHKSEVPLSRLTSLSTKRICLFSTEKTEATRLAGVEPKSWLGNVPRPSNLPSIQSLGLALLLRWLMHASAWHMLFP